ncbi:MAG: glycosyltransferase family 2 protein [Patescibacteria group bacterium]|nr:glycosyltransferase family 2 protein [Patescibacteria group bacterium]
MMVRKFAEKHEESIKRTFEIVPGFVIWAVILFPVLGSLIIPRWVSYFIIGFNVYWLYRSLKLVVYGISGYSCIKKSEDCDWQGLYYKEQPNEVLDWDAIRHVVIIPNAGEPVNVLAANLDALANQTLDNSKIFVVLAMEERVADSRKTAQILESRYKDKFGNLWTTFHPDNLVGEVVGKASNMAWAAQRAREKLADEGIDLSNVTLTSCDADGQFHPKYFEALTYEFAKDSDRYCRFWQSPIFWYNNIWEVPAFIRIIGILGNIIHVSDLQEPTQLFFNYSCYSTSFKMIHEVGYWDTDIIPEDWHIFLQCFFNFQGQVEVKPIFLPTSVDAPEGNTYFKSLVNRYKQCKRHAWGASDIPYAMVQFLKHPEIPLAERSLRIFKLIESHVLWSTNWFLITLGANLPPLLNPVFAQTTLGQNLMGVSQTLLAFSLLGLGAVILLDSALRPPRPESIRWWQLPAHYLQWFLMPIATLFMTTLPGLDSHTRLMLGKRLEYWVTEKI